MHLDLLAFSAHPDDVEFTSAGTMILMARKGYRTGIVDLTRGELGTRGDARTRTREADEAAKIMKLAVRRNLGMPDGNVESSQRNLQKVITVLREFRPRIILVPFHTDRHPDHADASALVRRAAFYSGLKKLRTTQTGKAQEAHRPEMILMYRNTTPAPPTIIVDVSSVWDDRMRAAKVYASQLHNPNAKEPNTFISRPEFVDYLEARAREYGFMISAKYGEAFYTADPIWNDDLFALLPDHPRIV